MPQLDVSDVLDDPDLADTFTVMRRPETVSNGGMSSTSPTPFPNVSGVVYPTDDNALSRGADEQHMGKSITVVTQFRLRGVAPGYQPDLVVWRGDSFVVRSINDYSAFGGGFIEAVCTSIDLVDQPPQ